MEMIKRGASWSSGLLMLCTARAKGAAPRPGRAQGAVHEPCSLSGGSDSSAAAEILGQTPNGVIGVAIGGDSLGGATARVHDRGVVAPPEGAADRRQRLVRELAREVHRDLARPGQRRRTARREQIVHRDLERLADAL